METDHRVLFLWQMILGAVLRMGRFNAFERSGFHVLNINHVII
jgi:hypothetical protein